MFKINTHFFYHFDWLSFSLTFMLAITGVFFVMSATYMPEHPYSIFFKKQAIGLFLGVIIYVLFCMLDPRKLMRYGYFIYFGVMLLLIYTIIKGTIGMGAQRWISLYFFKLQPSELCKLFLPAFISNYLFTHEQNKLSLSDFFMFLTVILFSIILVLKQPDLGTAILISISGIVLLIQSGCNKKWLRALLYLGIIGAPFSWHMLKPYQKQRIMVFLGHGEMHKERYQIEQSKIAIGSGGIVGKGYCKGTQNIFQFLPESRTDFIFAVLAEEWGFLGSCGLVLLYLILCLRLLYLTTLIKQRDLQLLGLGLITHIIASIFINIPMVLGLLPIVGIPLPLMSYGLSNLWVVLASLGWFNGIIMRRRQIPA